MNSGPQENSRGVFPIVLGIAVAILVLIAWIKPYFGLMDDARNLFSIVPKINAGGFSGFVQEFMRADFNWGMFRPLYPAMVYILYSFGVSLGPVPFFMLNAVLVFFVLYLSALSFEKWLGIGRWSLLMAMMAFPYTYDLFQHPSLQEKLITLFGSLALLAIPKDSKMKIKDFVVILIMTGLGFASKTSFLIYAPVIFLALLSRTNWQSLRSKIILAGTSVWMAAWVFFLGKVAAHGQYTREGYSLTHILPNLQRGGILAVVGSLIFFIILRIPRFSFRTFRNECQNWMPISGLAAFLTLFMPWTIAGYLLSLVSPFLAATVLQISGGLPKRIQPFVTGALAFFAVFLLYSRPYLMFHRLHDIGNLIGSSPSLQAQGIKNIVVPCMEGRDSIQSYLKNHAEFNLQMQSDGLNWRDTVVFADQKMCPYIPTATSLSHEGCREVIHMPSGAAGGFQVIGYQCGS